MESLESVLSRVTPKYLTEEALLNLFPSQITEKSGIWISCRITIYNIKCRWCPPSVTEEEDKTVEKLNITQSLKLCG